ncbi:MAG TPA: hypothetical protein VIP51_06775, partial [Eoetvoesiella sp.]
KLFNAAAVIALITIIVRLPLFGERKHTPFSTIAFFLIFCLYWVANPALRDHGQNLGIQRPLTTQLPYALVQRLCNTSQR